MTYLKTTNQKPYIICCNCKAKLKPAEETGFYYCPICKVYIMRINNKKKHIEIVGDLVGGDFDNNINAGYSFKSELRDDLNEEKNLKSKNGMISGTNG